MPDADTVTSSTSSQIGYSVSQPTEKKPTQKKTVDSVTVASRSQPGQAPYICTPSGFGRTSTCVAR